MLGAAGQLWRRRLRSQYPGAKGLPKGVKPGPDTATFPSVNTETEYGWTKKIKMKVPIFTAALPAERWPTSSWPSSLGAVGIFTATQKIRTGLQQLMAGSRNFNLSTITRGELMSLTEECESVTGIPYVMRAYRKEAEKILAQ